MQDEVTKGGENREACIAHQMEQHQVSRCGNAFNLIELDNEICEADHQVWNSADESEHAWASLQTKKKTFLPHLF